MNTVQFELIEAINNELALLFEVRTDHWVYKQ